MNFGKGHLDGRARVPAGRVCVVGSKGSLQRPGQPGGSAVLRAGWRVVRTRERAESPALNGAVGEQAGGQERGQTPQVLWGSWSTEWL